MSGELSDLSRVDRKPAEAESFEVCLDVFDTVARPGI